MKRWDVMFKAVAVSVETDCLYRLPVKIENVLSAGGRVWLANGR